MNTEQLLEEYATVAAQRAVRITAIAQERDAFAAAARTIHGSDADRARIRQLEAEVASLRRRLRRAEAALARVRGHWAFRAARRARRMVPRTRTPGGRAT
jgi:hypothetical protein